MPPGMSHIQDDEGYIQYVLCTLSLHIGGACTTSFLPTSQVQRFCLRIQMQSRIQVSISENIPLLLLEISNQLPALESEKIGGKLFSCRAIFLGLAVVQKCPKQVVDGNCKQNYHNFLCWNYICGNELAWDKCCSFWTINPDLHWLESLARDIFYSRMIASELYFLEHEPKKKYFA